MSEREPTRWLVAAPDEALHAVLASSRADDVDGARVARLHEGVTQALALGVGAATASGTSAGGAVPGATAQTSATALAGTGASAAALSSKLALFTKVAVTASLLTVGGMQVFSTNATPAPAPRVSLAEHGTPRASVLASVNRGAHALTAAPDHGAPGAEPRLAQRAPRAVRRTERNRDRLSRHREPPSPVTSRLRDEAALVADMRRAAKRDDTLLVALAARHQRDFSAGVLEQERDFLLLEAQLRLGRVSSACSVARQLLARGEGAAYREFARALLARTQECEGPADMVGASTK